MDRGQDHLRTASPARRRTDEDTPQYRWGRLNGRHDVSGGASTGAGSRLSCVVRSRGGSREDEPTSPGNPRDYTGEIVVDGSMNA